MKKIIMFILVFSIAVGGINIIPASAAADNDDMFSGEGIYRVDKDPYSIEKTAIEKSTDNNRLYDYNAKMSWTGSTSPDFKFFKAKNSDEKINIGEYQYINAWIYNPEIKKSTNSATKDKISNIMLLFRTGKSAADIAGAGSGAYLKHDIPMDWTGWKLVSCKISNFKGSADLNYGIHQIDFAVNGWSGNVPSWPEGDHYAYVDALWFSTDAPKTEISITNTSYISGEGYVPSDLGGDNTYVFETSSYVSESRAYDAITVKKDDEILESGYTISTENEKLKIIFDDKLQKRSTYDIIIGENLYDIYGNTLEDEYTTNFTVDAPSKFFKINESSVENGSENVSLDLNGDRTLIVTFNNHVDESESDANISILLNGIKLYDCYSIEVKENCVYIKMNNDLEPNAEYTIEFGSRFNDVDGNVITGQKTISFTTQKQSVRSDIIWEYTDDSSINASSNLLYSNENNRRNKGNAKLEWQTINKMFTFFKATNAGDKIRISEYGYLNLWMYNPEVKRNDDNKISNYIFVLRTGESETDVSGFYYYIYRMPADWVGWKLISIPLKNFENGKSGSSLDYGVYSISVEVNGWTGNTPAWTSDDNYAYVDIMWLSKEEPNSFSYVGCNFPSNFENIPIMDAQIELEFTNNVSDIKDGSVYLERADNGEIADVFVTHSANRIAVLAKKILEPDTEYFLNIDTNIYDESGQQLSEPVKYKFKTRKTEIEVGKPVFLVSDNIINSLPDAKTEITVKSNVYNYSQSEKSASLVVCQYDGYGNMTDISYDTKNFDEGAGSLSSVVVRNDNTVSIKAFIVDGLDSMTLLRQDYSVIGTDSQVNRKIYTQNMQAEYGLSIDKTELNIQNLKINGQNKGYDPVLIEIRSENNDLVLITPIYSDTKGSFSYYYTFGEMLTSGIYTVGIHSKNADSVYDSVVYFDADTRKEQLEIINTTDDYNDIIALLNDSKKSFGLEEFDDSGIKNVALSLYEQRSYASYNDMLDMMHKITACTNELNSKAWSGLSEFLKTNKNLVLGANSDYEYYAKLSEKNQNIINKEIVKHFPVSGFISFREIFSDEIESYKKENSSSGSSGGGSVGGGSKSKSDSLGIIPVIKPNNDTNEDVFDDLSQFSWAKDSIMKLYDKKIISAADDKKFRPNDNITREEFVKLITSTFNITPSNTSSGFSDVISGAWYEPYVIAAKQMNILLGDENGNFGVGKPITRQDMAVIIYRTLNSLNIWINNSNTAKNFSDSDEISDYAAEPLKFVQGAGIINGFEDGSFRPLENCTRAQAAKVIAELMKTVG